jgi:hypothetical protein
MFGDGALTFREYATREPLSLAVVHRAVLEFLQAGRTHRQDRDGHWQMGVGSRVRALRRRGRTAGGGG